MGLVVLVLFWVAVGFAFFVLNAKTELIFAALWIAGFVVVMALHLVPYFFLAYEAVLAACLYIKLKLEWS